MVWVEVIEKEISKFNPHSFLVKFKLNEKNCYSIVTNNVLDYNRIDDINIGDKIFVTIGFNKEGKKLYFIKKCQKKKV